MAEKPNTAALTSFHKVTIGSSVALGILFAIYSAIHANWIMAAVAAVVTVGLLIYLRWFLRKS